MTYRHIMTKNYLTYDIKFSHIVAALHPIACSMLVKVSASLYLQALLELSLVLGYAAGPAVGGGLADVCRSVHSHIWVTSTIFWLSQLHA